MNKSAISLLLFGTAIVEARMLNKGVRPVSHQLVSLQNDEELNVEISN